MNRLRQYQVDIINQTRQAFKDGYKSPCIVAPCGAGKSIVVAEIAKAATAKGNRVLFLVHRKELCEQIIETFAQWGVDMHLCYVGMVQTVARRMSRIHKPALIITDENHHSLAKTYRKIYEYFKDVPRIGVTATPIRLNGSGLGDVSDKLITTISADWLIEHEFLAPFDYYAPDLMDLSGLKTKRGEFVTGEVEERVNNKAIYGDVIKHYKELSSGKQAICYCVSIKHSERMVWEFNSAGITAMHIDGETPKNERTAAIKSFRSGDTMVLCNVDLISEGFDVPDCATSILLRPTMSLTLYIQQSMRCMRYKPNKKAVIIDHVGNYTRFGLPNENRVWKLNTIKDNETEQKIPIRTCPYCFMVLPIAVRMCPKCKAELVQERTIEEIKETALSKIDGFVLNYSGPEDCDSYAELKAFALQRGYKPGWAWYQAKRMGFIS